MSAGADRWRTTVRQVVEFCCRTGDIDFRFTPSPTAIQGIEGHQQLYRKRPDTYQSEFAVSERFATHGIDLELRGRADGYDASTSMLEEIKTCRVSLEEIPAATKRLHRSQALAYAALIARSEGLDEMVVCVTYFNIDSGEEFNDKTSCTRTELDLFLDDIVGRFSQWLLQRSRHCEARNSSAQELKFCHDSFRSGQRELAELTYKCQATGGRLLAEAPTGIGKTAATIFPSFKGLAAGAHDQLLYLTAKSQGRAVAESTLRQFVADGLRINSVSLTAKEKICFSPGKACQGEDCAYARGFYDRLPAALDSALAVDVLDRSALEAVASNHEVCPYQLAMELVPWVDVIICDYYYVYGWFGFLRSSDDIAPRRSVLVDEAHNLPGRARDMYSAGLAKSALIAARKQGQGDVRLALDALNRVLLDLNRSEWAEENNHVLTELPPRLMDSMTRVTSAVSAAMAEESAYLPARPDLMDFFFDCLQCQRVAERLDDDFQIELRRSEGKQSLRLDLRCLSPARLLAERHDYAVSTTCFSATLSPMAWMVDELGLGPRTVGTSLESPFEASQLSVLVDCAVDTRYRQREKSLEQLKFTLGNWVAQNSTNAVVYFPSYQYLARFLECSEHEFSGSRLWIQRKEQNEMERGELIELLRTQQNVLAFCILGGVFSEGIDLPGMALSRVAVVGVGTPRLSRENQSLSDYYERTGRPGFDFTYLYPGMQKVSQALGRVIRSESDRGEVLLLDSRYRQPQYLSLLPDHWHREILSNGSASID